MKTCSRCKKRKPLDCFYFDRTKQRHRADCKDCHKKLMRPRSKSHYENNHRYYMERNKKQKAKIKQIIDRAKAGKPCADCARLLPPYVMDFDHVRGVKRFNISGSHVYGEKAVLAEIAKCELVCANDHRIRTHERKVARRRTRTSDISPHHGEPSTS